MSCAHIYIGRWQRMRVWLRNVSDQINICFKQNPLLLVRIFRFQAIALKLQQIRNSCVFKRNKVHSAGIKRHRYTGSSFDSIALNQYMRHARMCMCLHRLLSVWNGERCYDCFGTNWKQQTTCNNLGEISIIMHNNHFMRLWIFLHIHMCRSPVHSILILQIHGVYFILMQPSLSPFGGIILCNNDVRMYRST